MKYKIFFKDKEIIECETLEKCSSCIETMLNALGDAYTKDDFKIYQQLEQEEELGISLEVILKAFKEGIKVTEEALVNTAYDNDLYEKKYKTYEYDDLVLYFSDYDNEYYFQDTNSPYGDIECGEYGCFVKLKDYQKTWWLKGEKDAKKEN